MTTEEQRKIDEQFMRKAIVEAEESERVGEIPIGAIVVCKGRIISRAHNLTETLCDVTAHAEIQALTAASATLGGKYLPDCTIYVTLEPCVMCAGALAWSQIGRIVYGAADPKRGYTTIDSRILHPKTKVTAGVLATECEALMNEFFSKLRR